jgi:hypothetical protein
MAITIAELLDDCKTTIAGVSGLGTTGQVVWPEPEVVPPFGTFVYLTYGPGQVTQGNIEDTLHQVNIHVCTTYTGAYSEQYASSIDYALKAQRAFRGNVVVAGNAVMTDQATIETPQLMTWGETRLVQCIVRMFFQTVDDVVTEIVQ